MHYKLLLSILFLLTNFLLEAQYHDSIRLNDIRILASHNSYKKKPNPKLIKFLQKYKKKLGEENNPERIDYGHLSFDEQLNNYSIRGFELDVYYDPKGKLYQKRKIYKFVKGLKPNAKVPSLNEPGFKMLHIADIDFETHYYTFIEGLKVIKKWSDEHPKHTPLFINIEPKDRNPGDYSKFLNFLGFKKALHFDSLAWNAFEDEILSVIPREKIVSPNDLQSTYSSIKDRLKNEGWPSLNECLGKVFFIIDGNFDHFYQKVVPNGVMFNYDHTPNESSAFLKRNNPFENPEEIQQQTELYIVRTRSDVETIEARKNDYSMYEAALKSQAQIISTDFYAKDPAFGDFQIVLNISTSKNLKWDFILRNL
ncbi:MAG: Ca2+-dependent phosphoinositide-specific phospholipase C [Bacteroidota bacterium]